MTGFAVANLRRWAAEGADLALGPAARAPDRQRGQNAPETSDYVFYSVAGRPINQSTVYVRFRGYLANAGMGQGETIAARRLGRCG